MTPRNNPALPTQLDGADADGLVSLAQTYDRIAHMDSETNLFTKATYREAAFRLRGAARAKLEWGDD